jgi:hypothetical protein
MSRRLVEYELESGGTIVVDAEDGDFDTAARPVTRGLHDVEGAMVERAGRTFESALATVEPATQSLLSHLRELDHGPQTISIEFGVSLHAAAGAIIAQTGGDANFKVTLTWRRDSQT